MVYSPPDTKYLYARPHLFADVHRNDREIGGQNISGSTLTILIHYSTFHNLRLITDCSNPLAWKRLIDPGFPVDKRVDLVTSIFSDRSEIKRVTNISGDDAQAFINAIDEVSLHAL